MKLKEYTNYLTSRFSTNTTASYLYDVNKLQKQIKITKNIKEKEINSFIQNLKDSNQTVRRITASLRNYFEFLYDNNYIKSNPMKNIKQPKKIKSIPEILTTKQIMKFFNIFNKNTSIEIRNKLMAELLYSSGLKITEAVELKLKDVDIENMLLTIRSKHERLIPLGEITTDLIKTYLPHRKNIYCNSSYLLVSQKNEKLNRKSAWRIIKSYAKKAKLTMTPQTLRHSFAAHLIQNGADIRAVQELLGHVDINCTKIYSNYP